MIPLPAISSSGVVCEPCNMVALPAIGSNSSLLTSHIALVPFSINRLDGMAALTESAGTCEG